MVKLCKNCGTLFRSTMPTAKWCPKCEPKRPYRKKKGLLSKVCENPACRKPFSTLQSKAKYCCDNCRKDGHYMKVETERTCKNPDCRKKFMSSTKREYCFPSCAYKAKMKREKERRDAE